MPLARLLTGEQQENKWFKKCLPQRTGTDWAADNIGMHARWRVVVVGEQDSGMFFHSDGFSSSTYHVQISGRKHWRVCTPASSPSLGNAGEVNTYDPDLSRFPRFAKAECGEVVVGPGDLFFYPAGWWHHTRCLDDNTVGLATRQVDRDAGYIQQMYQELRDHCDNPGEDVAAKWPGAAPLLCQSICDGDALKKCLKVWRRKYEWTGARQQQAEAAAEQAIEVQTAGSFL
jgi:hypothetical protein